MSLLSEEFIATVTSTVGDACASSAVSHGQLTITVASASLLTTMTSLRDEPRLAFAQLLDIAGVDNPAEQPRFSVVYHLLSLRHNQRIRVKVKTEETSPVPSITGIFPAAGWYEREAWDMFGIIFENHNDLRRILTDYGFDGHPLRKDFPLTGFTEVRYDEAQKRVVYGAVHLQQDYRNFDNLSPWEGMTTASNKTGAS